MKLTKRAVEKLEPCERDFTAWDADRPGFGVRVRSSGAKSYIAQYRIGGRNSPVQRVTIGRVGKLTLDQARNAANRVLAKAELGQDEAAERTEARKALTVEDLCNVYLEEGCDKKKQSTLAADRGRIVRHIKPLLGRKTVGAVTSADIEQFMRDVAKGKTAVDIKTVKHGRAIVTGGKGTATRTVRLLGGIFSFAKRRGLRADNPVHGVEKYPDARGQRFLSTTEYENLGNALREAATVGIPWDVDETHPNAKHVAKTRKMVVIGPHVTAAFLLLLLTGCRLREILHLKWSEVDFERRMLFLADSKTGQRAIVLNSHSLAILKSLKRIGTFVIAGLNAGTPAEKPRTDLKRPWTAITKHAGLKGLRIHDLRHSFASVGAGGGMGLPIVGKLLGHSSVSTTAQYAHLDNDPLRRASNAIAGTIAAELGDTFGPAVEVSEGSVLSLRTTPMR